MERECKERLEKITQGFQECRKAFTAIGDETRQLILLVLMRSDMAGIRVGEIADASDQAVRVPPSADIKGGRDHQCQKGRHEKLLLYQCG